MIRKIYFKMEDVMKYVADKIGEDYKNWSLGSNVFISSPTGSGKTSFILNTYLPYLADKGLRILFLVNRTILKEDLETKLCKLPQQYRQAIDIETYQSLESKLLKLHEHEYKSDYEVGYETAFNYMKDSYEKQCIYQLLEPKNKSSIRTIPMLDEVHLALVEQKRRQDKEKQLYSGVYEDRGFVFANPTGNYLAQRSFMDDYHTFLKKYGIKDIRFHDLRHTFASLLIESDVSMKVLQDLLGHSTITTSMDIYAHVSQKKKIQEIKRLPLSQKQIE